MGVSARSVSCRRLPGTSGRFAVQVSHPHHSEGRKLGCPRIATPAPPASAVGSEHTKVCHACPAISCTVWFLLQRTDKVVYAARYQGEIGVGPSATIGRATRDGAVALAGSGGQSVVVNLLGSDGIIQEAQRAGGNVGYAQL